MGKITEFSFHVSLDLTVTIQDCESKHWGATGEELAANQRLLQAVLHDPAMLRLVVRYHITSDLIEAFGWDMVAANPIFVDDNEEDRRLAELVKTHLSKEDQYILIYGDDDESLSDQAITFADAFNVNRTNLQVHPIVEATPDK